MDAREENDQCCHHSFHVWYVTKTSLDGENMSLALLCTVLSPLASSMFTPGIGEIAADLGTTGDVVVGATTGFVVFLGIGPLILAPLSETFGRRKLYLSCFSIFETKLLRY